MRSFVCLVFVFALAFSFVVCTSGVDAADWVDSWIAQHSSTGPNYFEGQKRGYFTAGGFSVRWPQQTDYLFTVQAPRLRSGCGGIDAFLGGFSFLNFDYLVQKLQRILQAAPAAAFDIALSTLCEKCSNTIKSLESMIDQLNNLQLDECQASKALVATIAKPFTGQEDQKKLSEIQSDFMQSTGIEDLYHKIQKKTKTESGRPQVDMKQAVSGCSAELKYMLGIDVPAGTRVYMLNRLAERFGMSASGLPDILRAYIGDIVVDVGDRYIKASYEAGCPEAKSFDVDDVVEGRVSLKPAGGNCSTSSQSKLRTYVDNRLARAANAMRTKGSINFETDTDVSAFIRNTPLPITLILKHAVGTQQEGPVIGLVSDVVTKAYAYAVISDAYYRAHFMFNKAVEAISKASNPTSGQSPEKCRLEAAGDLPEKIAGMQNLLYNMLAGIRNSYVKSIQEVSTVWDVVGKMQRFDEMAARELSQRFGGGIVARTLSK